MIVHEPETAAEPFEDWQTLSVMLLSPETWWLSNTDISIPSVLTGIEQELLAETWHVVTMLACNLSHRVGQRLSREIYDVLLTVGDYHHGLVDAPPSTQTLKALGLRIGDKSASHFDIQAFHQREEGWADVLTVPVMAYHTCLERQELADSILAATFQFERESVAIEILQQPESNGHDWNVVNHSAPPSAATSINLNQWFQDQIQAGWQTIQSFWTHRSQQLAVGVRSGANPDSQSSDAEVVALLSQIVEPSTPYELRRIIRRLGAIATAKNVAAIEALLALLQTEQDDETLWTIIESLWRIHPEEASLGGISRARVIDLGMQLAGQSVALAVALIRKADQHVGILLRVYSTDNSPYLPEGLKLVLLSDARQSLRQVTSRKADIYIQLKFSGQTGERFSVRLTFGDASITEDFVI